MQTEKEKRGISKHFKEKKVEVEVEKTREKKKTESTVDDAFAAAVSIASRRVLPLSRFSRAHFLTEGLKRLVRMPPRKRRGADDEVSEKKGVGERERGGLDCFRRGKKKLNPDQPLPTRQQQPAATATGTEDSLCRAVKRLATSESQGALPDAIGGGEGGAGGQQAGAPEVRRRTSRGQQQQQQQLQPQAEAEAAAEASPPPAAATIASSNAFDEDYEATNQLLRRMHFERMSRLQREKEAREKEKTTNG